MSTDLAIVAATLKNGRYRHYKGKEYQVLMTARHSETREWVVVYRCLYDDYSIWVRPLEMFIEDVLLENGQSVMRFAYISEVDGELLKK
ncbi:MAG: DUF1653 domain-containing protein [Gammaproteobacteria bacterium]|nr:DUF1653 domain-containing protein [Gammaproteobacteria bacterium]